MATVTEIEAAISRLSEKELADLVAWMQEFHTDAGDRRIEADLETAR